MKTHASAKRPYITVPYAKVFSQGTVSVVPGVQPYCMCGVCNWLPHVFTAPTCRGCGAVYPLPQKGDTMTMEVS